MGFPVDSFGNSMGFLWIFHDISIGFRKHVYEISAGLLWDLKDFYGISMVFPRESCGLFLVGFA